jgi:hypothetical protein
VERTKSECRDCPATDLYYDDHMKRLVQTYI